MADSQVPSQTSDPWEDAAKQYNAARNPGPPSLIKVGQRTSYAPKPVSDEEWKLWNAQSQDPQKPDFWGSLWGEIKNGPANLLGVGNAINANVSDAVHGRMPRAINQMGDAIAETGRKTKEAAQQGDYLGAARHAMNTGINAVAPGLGNSSDESGDMFTRGEYGPATGKMLGMGVNTVIGLKTPQIMEGAANLPNTVRGAFRADPRVAVNRGLRPTPSDSDFSARVPSSLRRIQEANGGENPAGSAFGKKSGVTDGQLDLIPATQKAIDAHETSFGKWMERARGVEVPGDAVVQATADAVSPVAQLEAPESVQSVLADAQRAYGGRRFTVGQLDALRRAKNAELDAFYDKATGKQIADTIAGKSPAIVKAQRDAIAEAQYRAMDPEGAGSGPRQIKASQGDLLDILNAANRRNNAIVAEQPLTPVGKVLDPVKGAIRSVIPGKATGAGIAYAEGSEGRSLPYLRKAFKSVGNEPSNALPEPGEPLYPTGDTTRQLGPPDVFTPPPADSSYVRGVDAKPAPLSENRQLPPPRSMGSKRYDQNFTRPAIITPPPADTSGVRVTTGEPLRAPTSRQIPQGPSVRTPSDLSGQAGDITDLVPVKNPVTGKIEYIPRPQDTKDLPHYAKGGVIHKPTLLVDMASGKPSGVMAEKGPERIVPMHPPRLESPGREMKHELNSEKAKLSPWRMGNLKPDQANFHMAKKPDAPIPNGESFNSFKRRTIGTLQKLLKHHAKNPEAKISVPSSGHATKLAEAWVKRGAPPSMEIDQKHMMGKGTPGSHRLFLAGGKPRIESSEMKSGKGGIYLTEDSGKLPTLKTPA
jgi:hypothetical protein